MFDVLNRYLESKGYTVQLVQNFTDVDDKIIDRANKEDISAIQISEKYIKQYHHDFDSLNIKRATLYPKATEHIADMISLIADLIQKKMAYTSKNGVYFAVSKFPEYGKLSKKRIDDLQAGSRVQIDEDKKDPLDFALWKFVDSKPRWDSPWGTGRPGWHIECSTMSLKYLGNNFDIHGGGRDLIFPHHENEIAQSEAHTSKQFAKIWMHVGMVTINGEKMSKSLGNIKSVQHVLDNWGPNVIRLFCLSAHYLKPIDYSEELLKENLIKWRQIEIAYFELLHNSIIQNDNESLTTDKQIQKTICDYETEFNVALDDNFNTHEALSAFFRLVKEINKLAASQQLDKNIVQIIKPKLEYFMNVLGLVIPKITFEEIKSINQLIIRREALRRSNQYEKADKIRDEISALNVEILDHKSRSSWVKKEKIKSG